jgi:hypothetical protein
MYMYDLIRKHFFFLGGGGYKKFQGNNTLKSALCFFVDNTNIQRHVQIKWVVLSMCILHSYVYYTVTYTTQLRILHSYQSNGYESIGQEQIEERD